jgi:energy-coupling factor transporter ATP-binding protein EcfA2
MDCRLKNGAIIQVVGPSGSGKTYFVINLIKNRNNMFKNKVKSIHWIQGSSKEIGVTKKSYANLHINRYEISTNISDTIEKIKLNRHDMIVLDDVFIEARNSNQVTNLFTKTARHEEVTVVYITQNMFHAGNANRTRNLNVHYLILFRNPRDSLAIEQIARQMYSDKAGRQFLIQAFRDATQDKPHGYLFFDFTQECPDFLRIRTNLFNSPYVYKQLSRQTSAQHEEP